MATVRVSFDGGDVLVITGDIPPNDETAIADPTLTGYTTNRPFIVAEGIYCFGLETAQSHSPLWQVVQAVDGDIGRMVAQGKLRRIVVIAINARSDPPNKLDQSTAYTTVLTMAEAISGVLVDSASSNSALGFQSFVKSLTDDRDRLIAAGQAQANFAVYPISIDFDQLPNATDGQRQEQQRVKSIATSWTLRPGDVALLDKVAGELLWRHPLVADIGLQGNPETPPVPTTRCPVEPPRPVPAPKARPQTM